MVNLKEKKEFFGTIVSVEESTVKDEITRPIKVTKASGKKIMSSEDRLKKFMEKMKIPEYLNEASEKELMDWKLKQIKAKTLAITYTYQGEEELIERREWFKIPTSRGYNRSNLKSLIIINNLPDETDEWIGKKVRLDTNQDGFVEFYTG